MYRRRYTRKPEIPVEIRSALSLEAPSENMLANRLDEKDAAYMTVKELQEHLHICRRTANTIFHMDGFPAYKVGHSIRIDRKGVDEWVHAHSTDESS